MEAFLLHGSLDQQTPPHKSHIGKNHRKIQQYPFISRPYNNFSPSNFQSRGLLQTPTPFLTHSYPPYSLRPPPQPPLLPLPAAANIRRSSSTPPPNRSGNRTRDPNKSKSPKKEEKKKPKKPSAAAVTVSLTSPSEPDPNELPKHVTANVFRAGSTGNTGIKAHDQNQVDVFPGSMVFTISPPPSSLPLPGFSLRPKLSCNAKAAGVDAGATDDLRRLLRLQ